MSIYGSILSRGYLIFLILNIYFCFLSEEKKTYLFRIYNSSAANSLSCTYPRDYFSLAQNYGYDYE